MNQLSRKILEFLFDKHGDTYLFLCLLGLLACFLIMASKAVMQVC